MTGPERLAASIAADRVRRRLAPTGQSDAMELVTDNGQRRYEYTHPDPVQRGFDVLANGLSWTDEPLQDAFDLLVSLERAGVTLTFTEPAPVRALPLCDVCDLPLEHPDDPDLTHTPDTRRVHGDGYRCCPDCYPEGDQ